MPGSLLDENLRACGARDHHDHFTNVSPNTDWRSCMEHGEKIGLGTRSYELITVKWRSFWAAGIPAAFLCRASFCTLYRKQFELAWKCQFLFKIYNKYPFLRIKIYFSFFVWTHFVFVRLSFLICPTQHRRKEESEKEKGAGSIISPEMEPLLFFCFKLVNRIRNQPREGQDRRGENREKAEIVANHRWQRTILNV